jgi:hypothetical protein
MRANELRELKRLFDALREAGFKQYKVQLSYVHDLLRRTPRFRSIFELLKTKTSEFDVDAWMKNEVFGARRACHEWPPTEPEKLRVLLRIMEVCATEDACDPTNVGRILSYGENLDESAQAFTTHVVFPLVDYLQARLGTESEVLHHFERMRRQIEWFEQPKLYAEFDANPSKGEAIYDRRVREFLFADGIDYPYSQPASPAGKADVVAGLDSDDPLVCEIKLYDGGGYRVPYLKQGVGQAIRYAHDYGKSSAYLVVFNLSDDRLQLPSDEPVDRTPPRLQVEGVTVFIVVVQAKPLPSASTDRHRQVRTVERDQLVPTHEELSGPVT